MKGDIEGLVFCGFIVILLFIISMILRSGQGAFLINGYNIMPKEKKDLYNEKALCRLFSNLLLMADVILLFIIIAGINEITWLIILLTAILIITAISMTIYAFTNVKFRK